jgi:hypothetical protein
MSERETERKTDTLTLLAESVNSKKLVAESCQPIKEGSRLTNDPLQVALAQYYQEHQRAIEHVGAVAQEKLAYELLKKAEAHLQECVDHWNACQTRMHATAPRN